LSHGINIPDVPVIEVDTVMKDHALNKQIEGKNEFVESLHHRSWIIQVNKLKDHHRDELEQLLDIFAQENRTQNQHILNVKEEDFPEEYRSIISRFRMAAESEQVQGEMELEDDIIKELQDKDRLVAEREEENEKLKISLEEKEKALEKNKEVIEEKDKTLEEKEKTIEEKEKTIEEKENANLKKYLEEQAKEIEALKKKITNNQ
jgi:hypothetical protein